MNLCFFNWFYEKRFNVFIRKEIIKCFSRKFDCRLNPEKLEIFIKYLLNALAMSSGLVNKILLSITAEVAELEVLLRDISFLIPFQVSFKSLIFV